MLAELKKLLRGRPGGHTRLESPSLACSLPSALGSQQMLADEDGDFEESSRSLNFSSEVWKWVPGLGKKGGKQFSLISSLFLQSSTSPGSKPRPSKSPFLRACMVLSQQVPCRTSPQRWRAWGVGNLMEGGTWVRDPRLPPMFCATHTSP